MDIQEDKYNILSPEDIGYNKLVDEETEDSNNSIEYDNSHDKKISVNIPEKLTKKQRQKRNRKIRKQNEIQKQEQEKLRVKLKDETIKVLKANIEEKRIQRSSKQIKEDILDKTLKNLGIDKEKFKNDMEAVKKQGGITINLK